MTIVHTTDEHGATTTHMQCDDCGKRVPSWRQHNTVLLPEGWHQRLVHRPGFWLEQHVCEQHPPATP